MASGHSLPQINLVVQGGSHRGSQRVNPEFRVGSNFRNGECVAKFLENIDNNLRYYEIHTQLACAYLKGHLTGRALDWFEVLGYRVVEDKATDYAHLRYPTTCDNFFLKKWRYGDFFVIFRFIWYILRKKS
ncbi:uncharacterized protein TNCV_3998481 [Trichonephila clavipes]|nr:uncharacterized protein TNCV_3998481 [Trichonephila clavipes]